MCLCNQSARNWEPKIHDTFFIDVFYYGTKSTKTTNTSKKCIFLDHLGSHLTLCMTSSEIFIKVIMIDIMMTTRAG